MYKKQLPLFNDVIELMVMKMRLKMKNRPRPRHGPNYTKYKMCLSIMMVICIKQHLTNI